VAAARTQRGHADTDPVFLRATGRCLTTFSSSAVSPAAAIISPGARERRYNPCPTRFAEELTVSDADLQAELERLRAENERLKKSGRGKLAMKVSEKGALSVYGMGRFPVTLYKEQWLRLLAMGDEIKAFIEANNESLKAKE
jgi:hypothetical protein